MDEKRIERIEALDSKIDELLTAKALLQNELKRINLKVTSLIEGRNKIIKFDSWMHHYSETVLVQKMDLYDDVARYYWNIMEYCKLHMIPKSSWSYQVAKCKYRTAIVNLESIIDKINWIDSKFYRKEF